jgi:hypothetical protein
MPRTKLTYGRVSIVNVKTAITNYKVKYYNAMKRLMRDAAVVFVHSAVENVHVDTGMSAASLEPMAKKVRTSILPKISPKRSRFGGMTMTGRYVPKKIRSVFEGTQVGRTAYKFNYGSRNRPYMSFQFQIKVWQYWYWEPQWQSLLNASIDAEIFIDNNYEKYLPEGLNKVFKYGTPNVNY